MRWVGKARGGLVHSRGSRIAQLRSRLTAWLIDATQIEMEQLDRLRIAIGVRKEQDTGLS